jgi:hypothetical protein
MEFRLLGPLEVLGDHLPVQIAAGKQRALLAILLLNANRTVSREQLIDSLWGETVPESAQKMVQIQVSQLRKALPEPRLQTRRPGYLLEVGEGELDLARFERAVPTLAARSPRAIRRTQPSGWAGRSRSGAAPRWPSSRSPSPGMSAPGSRSLAWPRSNCGSRPSSRSGISATSSVSSRR